MSEREPLRSAGGPSYLGGRMLIAMPGIEDPRFERAVLLVCTHDEQHAMGIAVNRPVEGLTVPGLLERLGVKPVIELPPDFVLLGGPVSPERGFVLHTDDYRCEDSSVDVGGGVALTATREVLTAIGSHNRRPRRSILTLGYAGWGAGQLEHEIREGVWLTCEADEALLFGDDHEHKWSMALAKIGVSAQQLSSLTGRA
ncbi:MAG TPA: YqgE/AlgH family protein [Caulobacteraceae bacterium]|nr:YqgE/AlgH family protein [Caulobacteraceae bacterium]